MKVPAMPRMQCALAMVLVFIPCQSSLKMGVRAVAQVLAVSEWEGVQVPPRAAAGLCAQEPDEGAPMHHFSCFEVTTPEFLSL
jgi:hypothetical protein